jgi:hypothetical protein
MNLGYNHGSTGNLYDTEYDRSAELDDETEEQKRERLMSSHAPAGTGGEK